MEAENWVPGEVRWHHLQEKRPAVQHSSVALRRALDSDPIPIPFDPPPTHPLLVAKAKAKANSKPAAEKGPESAGLSGAYRAAAILRAIGLRNPSKNWEKEKSAKKSAKDQYEESAKKAGKKRAKTPVKTKDGRAELHRMDASILIDAFEETYRTQPKACWYSGSLGFEDQKPKRSGADVASAPGDDFDVGSDSNLEPDESGCEANDGKSVNDNSAANKSSDEASANVESADHEEGGDDSDDDDDDDYDDDGDDYDDDDDDGISTDEDLETLVDVALTPQPRRADIELSEMPDIAKLLVSPIWVSGRNVPKLARQNKQKEYLLPSAMPESPTLRAVPWLSESIAAAVGAVGAAGPSSNPLDSFVRKGLFPSWYSMGLGANIFEWYRQLKRPEDTGLASWMPTWNLSFYALAEDNPKLLLSGLSVLPGLSTSLTVHTVKIPDAGFGDEEGGVDGLAAVAPVTTLTEWTFLHLTNQSGLFASPTASASAHHAMNVPSQPWDHVRHAAPNHQVWLVIAFPSSWVTSKVTCNTKPGNDGGVMLHDDSDEEGGSEGESGAASAVEDEFDGADEDVLEGPVLRLERRTTIWDFQKGGRYPLVDGTGQLAEKFEEWIKAVGKGDALLCIEH